jgi:hypothetical protein
MFPLLCDDFVRNRRQAKLSLLHIELTTSQSSREPKLLGTIVTNQPLRGVSSYRSSIAFSGEHRSEEMGRNGTQGKGKPGLKDKGFGACLIKRHQQNIAGTRAMGKEPTNMKSFLDESALVRMILISYINLLYFRSNLCSIFWMLVPSIL